MFSKRVFFIFEWVVVAMGLTACSNTPNVRYDYDAKATIGNYHSYVWEQVETDATVDGPAFKNPINEQRLRDAVQNQLAVHGLQAAAAGAKSDSYVTLALGTRPSVEPDSRVPVRVGFGFGTWQPGFGSSLYWSNDGLYNYREGRITIDLYDAETRKPIWHATVEQDLSYLTGRNAEARINAVVAAMFAKFPGAASVPTK